MGIIAIIILIIITFPILIIIIVTSILGLVRPLLWGPLTKARAFRSSCRLGLLQGQDDSGTVGANSGPSFLI